MESITTINNLSTLVLILINAGGAFRILFCVFLMMGGDIQEGQQMKKRIINNLIFLMVANGLVSISNVAKYYWG